MLDFTKFKTPKSFFSDDDLILQPIMFQQRLNHITSALHLTQSQVYVIYFSFFFLSSQISLSWCLWTQAGNQISTPSCILCRVNWLEESSFWSLPGLVNSIPVTQDTSLFLISPIQVGISFLILVVRHSFTHFLPWLQYLLDYE